MNFPHPFIIIKLLFSHHRSFLRYTYLIESYWRIGTEFAMHLMGRAVTPGPPQGPLSFMTISLSEEKSKVWPQEHFPTPVLNSVALLLKLLCGILTSDKLLYILFH